MKPRLRTQRGAIGNELFIRLPDVTGYPRTNMTSDSSAGASSLATKDASFLSANAYLFVGDPGSPESEVGQTTTVTSGKTIALTGTMTFPHAQGTTIYLIPFNQVRIQKSTDGGSTYSTVTTVALNLGNPEQYYNDTTGTSTDYYRVLFYNSTSSLTSDPSDGLIATGYTDNTVFAIKKRAVEASGLTLDSIYKADSIISDQFLNEALFEGRRKVHRHDGRKRWSFRQSYEYNLGDVTAGTNRIALPDDLDDSNTDKNLYSVRIGSHRLPLTPITKSRWNELQSNVRHTTLATAITSTGNTTISLTDSGDFEESGSISIIDNGTQDDISYTGNTESTGTLTGVTDITATHVISLDVWQNASFGLPQYYTVFGGYINFDSPIADDYHGENYMLDYYKKVTAVDSDADILEEIDYDMYVPWLKWRIRQARNQGIQPLKPDDDPDYSEFDRRVKEMAAADHVSRPLELIPEVSLNDLDE